MTNKNINSRKNISTNILLYIIISIISFIFLMNSPLHPWKRQDVATDSGVFKLVSFMIRKGYIPYRDTFDHKGPLLYILNYIGDCISTYKGVWIVEFFSLSITFFFIYKTARLFTKIEGSVIVTLLASAQLFLYFDGGNYSEEYAMPFISIGIYIFAKFFLFDNITRIELIFCGFSFGSVLMLRVNMISLWIVMCFAVLIFCLSEKHFNNIMIYILWFLIGALLIIIPLLLWLFVNDALIPFWNDYIVFNMQYSSKMSGNSIVYARSDSFFTFLNTPVNLLAFVSMFFLLKAKKTFFNVAYLAYLLSTLLLICVSGQTYMHYGMILIPAVAYPIAGIFEYISDLLPEKRLSLAIMTLVNIYLISSFVLPSWIDCLKLVPSYYESRHYDGRSENVKKIASLIDQYTNENEHISVYGNWDYIYVVSNRIPASIYSYQYPIGQVHAPIMDEYFGQLNKELPPIVVIKSNYFFDEKIAAYLNNNNYELLWPQDTNFEENDSPRLFILSDRLQSE